jgi:hypothetical protein
MCSQTAPDPKTPIRCSNRQRNDEQGYRISPDRQFCRLRLRQGQARFARDRLRGPDAVGAKQERRLEAQGVPAS